MTNSAMSCDLGLHAAANEQVQVFVFEVSMEIKEEDGRVSLSLTFFKTDSASAW
jgi:hypothetical protein